MVSIEKKASHLLGLRGRHLQLRPALQAHHSSGCSLHGSKDQGEGGRNGQVVSIKGAADGRRHRSRKIIYEKREKYRAKNESLQNTLAD